MQPDRATLVPAARGKTPADLVLKNATIFNPFTCTWDTGNLAIKEGIVLGCGEYTGAVEEDLTGKYLVPGLIDSHVHIESSLLTPKEYARLVARHGTTTVIADPHEIANVAGTAGIEFMLAERKGAAIDIQYLLPSCVPATPADIGGAELSENELSGFIGRDGILGLGEMMNFPGVLSGDPEVTKKIALCPLRDGHAPFLTGNDLNAYILAGLQSDHECTNLAEAEEKLKKGMYIYLREGSTERNIEALAPLVTPLTVPRCCFATDDCHADMLMNDGHIDRCIRRAVACGIPPALALRMATLSAADRFGLTDRGALSPGRRADFCIISDPATFVVERTFVCGKEVTPAAPARPAPLSVPFRCTAPSAGDLKIDGTGSARVIGLIPHQIVTESLVRNWTGMRRPGEDLQKVVVCNRYGRGIRGIGLVHGFGFRDGAIASSVAHDAHNLVATGTDDDCITRAIEEVIRMQGGMAAVCGPELISLPLDCGGLMSSLPYEEVAGRLLAMQTITRKIGGIDDPFMYLSFLSLTVIPALRITDRGVFDGAEFRDVPLFMHP
ncbi:MAG: adenine deaminase [Methanomicrobiales archaeon HGW-Methanomicrobiales-3]|jgi:adenine deaminase|nr:MAG: adenine deaminase [Methanomicrobiales archaeon HGW-Methanomicrobiales-3]